MRLSFNLTSTQQGQTLQRGTFHVAAGNKQPPKLSLSCWPRIKSLSEGFSRFYRKHSKTVFRPALCHRFIVGSGNGRCSGGWSDLGGRGGDGPTAGWKPVCVLCSPWAAHYPVPSLLQQHSAVDKLLVKPGGGPPVTPPTIWGGLSLVCGWG